MDTHSYYTRILDDSEFRCVTNIPECDFGFVTETATNQITEYFQPSRWAELGATSLSIRPVHRPFYESFGVIAWGRFNDIHSEGSLFDVDVIFHELGMWQIVVTELDVDDDDDCHSYAFTTTSPFKLLLESINIGFKTEHLRVRVQHQIEEMTK